MLRTESTAAGSAAGAESGSRPAYFTAAGWVEDCTVYDRYALRPGTTLVGPALIEERESTAVLGPGDRAEVDRYGNLLVDIEFD